MHQCDRQTDRQTDGRTIAYSALSIYAIGICCRALKIPKWMYRNGTYIAQSMCRNRSRIGLYTYTEWSQPIPNWPYIPISLSVSYAPKFKTFSICIQASQTSDNKKQHNTNLDYIVYINIKYSIVSPI